MQIDVFQTVIHNIFPQQKETFVFLKLGLKEIVHSKLKCCPFATHPFVGVGSGGIFLIHITIMDFHVHPMNTYNNHPLNFYPFYPQTSKKK